MKPTNEEEKWDRFVSSVLEELKSVFTDALKSMPQFNLDADCTNTVKKVAQRIMDDYEKIRSNEYGKRVVNIFIAHYHAPGSMNIQEVNSLESHEPSTANK